MSRDDEVLAAVVGRRPSRKGWIRADCPFCLLVYGKEDRTQALGLNVNSGKWHCFRCGERGKVKPELLDGTVPAPPKDEAVKKMEPPEGFLPLAEEPAASSWAFAELRRYLYDVRRIPEQTALEVGIGACARGFWSGRIIVPIRRPDGEWVGYVGRAAGKHPMRYRYPLGMDRGGAMFNEGALLVETEKPLLVVEGCFDALPFWPDAAAVLGKPTARHERMLLDARRPLVICLDGDAWAQGQALAWQLLMAGMEAGYVRLPPTKDPDDCRLNLREFAQVSLERGFDGIEYR